MTGGVVARLWTRAPLWRGAMLLALLSTGLAALHVDAFWPRAAPSQPILPGSYLPAPLPVPAAAPTPAPVAAPVPAQSAIARAPAVASAAASPGLPPFGKTYAGQLALGEFLVPLTEGDWVVVASQSGRMPTGQPVAAAILARIVSDRMMGAVMAVGTAAPDMERRGYPRSDVCTRGDPIYDGVVSNEDRGRQSCWKVDTHGSRFWSPDSPLSLMRAAVGDLTQRKVVLPPLMGSMFFHNADQERWLDVSYFIAGPVPTGPRQPDESDWTKRGVLNSPAKLGFVDGIRDWGLQFQTQMLEGFGRAGRRAGRPSAGMPASP